MVYRQSHWAVHALFSVCLLAATAALADPVQRLELGNGLADQCTGEIARGESQSKLLIRYEKLGELADSLYNDVGALVRLAASNEAKASPPKAEFLKHVGVTFDRIVGYSKDLQKVNFTRGKLSIDLSNTRGDLDWFLMSFGKLSPQMRLSMLKRQGKESLLSDLHQSSQVLAEKAHNKLQCLRVRGDTSSVAAGSQKVLPTSSAPSGHVCGPESCEIPAQGAKADPQH